MIGWMMNVKAIYEINFLQPPEKLYLMESDGREECKYIMSKKEREGRIWVEMPSSVNLGRI